MNACWPDLLMADQSGTCAPQMSIGRNDPCPCGSGRKYKRCCLDKDSQRTESAGHLQVARGSTSRASSGLHWPNPKSAVLRLSGGKDLSLAELAKTSAYDVSWKYLAGDADSAFLVPCASWLTR